MKELFDYLPETYKNSQVAKEVMAAQQIEGQKVERGQESVIRNVQPSTAAEAMGRWEAEYDVKASKELDTRRSNVIAKMRGQGITGKRMIEDIAESYANGDVDVTEDAEDFMIHIDFKSKVGIPPDIEKLGEILYELIPAHADFTFHYHYNTHGMIKRAGLTHAELGKKTHKQIREEALTDADGNDKL